MDDLNQNQQVPVDPSGAPVAPTDQPTSVPGSVPTPPVTPVNEPVVPTEEPTQAPVMENPTAGQAPVQPGESTDQGTGVGV